MSHVTAVKGFKDLLPEEAGRWRFVESQAREFLGNFGFHEIRPPLVEKAALFRRGIGVGTDVVEKEMYTFTDKNGEGLTLRPEATAGVIRAYIENGIFNHESVSKLYTVGPMFRRERPQKGRLRQFHQINAEVFGVAEPIIDAEMVVMLWSFLANLGLKSLSLEMNSLGCPMCRPLFRDELVLFLEGKSERLCHDCQRRMAVNPLRVLDCKVQTCLDTIANAPVITGFICDDCRTHFDKVREYLASLSVAHSVNPRMVRGLDYYTKTAFEIKTDHLGAQNSVCGGGRYDGLVKHLGGPDVPGVGFAIGVERLLALLPENLQFANNPRVFIAPLGEAAHEKAFMISNFLRLSGVSCVNEYRATRSLKAMLKHADKIGARLVMIMGDDEVAGRTVIIRDLKHGKQRSFSTDNLEEIVAVVQREEM